MWVPRRFPTQTITVQLQVTNAVFLGTPEPFGFQFTPYAIAGLYGTPIVSLSVFFSASLLKVSLKVAVVLGEIIGRYTNDWIMNISVRRNGGVFEAESRLWCVKSFSTLGKDRSQFRDRACYLAVPLYVCGFIVLGASLQNHLNVGALIMGWGIAECA